MFASVKREFGKAVEDYANENRVEWIKTHPAQCVLNCSQVWWTTEVETAMEESEVEGVRDYFKVLDGQIMDLVQAVRGKLSKLQKISFNALIVIDVHARQVVDDLGKDGIGQKNAFEWIKNLRYYWDTDCTVSCLQTNFPYGYEYMGNSWRLVITPLTDKCYITLMGALNVFRGGAPAGPAGTGKTETTKDLAKGLSKQCVVFNCSPEMSSKMLGKFFKGLACCGAWACFDEFNRIIIEVLSVIA